jgi:hypothetical protein
MELRTRVVPFANRDLDILYSFEALIYCYEVNYNSTRFLAITIYILNKMLKPVLFFIAIIIYVD